MYNLLHLKAGSEEEFFIACDAAGLVFDGKVITASKDHAIDIIGEIRVNTGETTIDNDGNELPVLAIIDGYHANIKSRVKLGIEHLSISVDNPQRKFAGD